MGSAILNEDGEQEGGRLAGEAQLFGKLRELTRNGYFPDSNGGPATAGILLRHATAPDLILQPDGTIDLPVGQSAKPGAPEPAAPQRMSKLRTLVIVFLAAGLWFLSVALTASMLEGM